MLCLSREALSYSRYSAWGGGAGVLLYINHILRYAPPQGVWFLCLYGLKMGIDFAHFGLESGMVFGGTTGVYERIILSFQFQMNKKEREICEFKLDLKNFFSL